MDTIFARSTPPGRAGVCVVRVSGPQAREAVERLTRRPAPEPRQLVLRKIWCGDGVLDIGLVAIFAEGHSFTGEPSAEFHVHGSEAVVRRLLAELGGFPWARMAAPGEFTHRALRNDRLDLSAVEGLSALLQAETEEQRKQAVRVVDGALRRAAEAWRGALVRALAAIEVTVDFADEEVPQDVAAGLASQLGALAAEMRAEAKGAQAAEKIARGFEVAIVGAPNVGKSTLLNRLAGREAALTSDVAGTTRDVIEVRMEIAGQFVTLLDTAGVREATDSVERAGVDLAIRRARAADLRVFIDAPPPGLLPEADDLRVRGKADLPLTGSDGLAVSGLTGVGVDRLLDEIGQRLSARVAGVRSATTARQAEALIRGAGALEEAGSVLSGSPDRVEIAGELVRQAIRALDEVVGRIGVEDVLGEIFSQFCIGK